MKNKKTLALGIIAVAILLGACSLNPTVPAVENSTERSISVTGTGMVKVVPDIAYINVGVRNQAASVEDALDLNTVQAQAIKEVLLEAGVEEEDIQTSNFTVYPQSNYDFQGVITSTTFVVENNVYVTVRDLDTLGRLLETVTRNGANNIYGINFDVEDKSEALSEARKIALEFARSQAEEIAEISGVRLGEVLTVDMHTSDVPYMLDSYGIGGGLPQGAAKVPVSVGNYIVTANVQVKFAIE